MKLLRSTDCVYLKPFLSDAVASPPQHTQSYHESGHLVGHDAGLVECRLPVEQQGVTVLQVAIHLPKERV